MALHPAVSPAAQLGVLNNLSALHQDRGQYEPALAVAEEAVAFAQQRFPKTPAMHLVALNNRATCLMHLSRLAEAQTRFEEARALLRDNPSMPALRRLRLLDNLAELYARLNDAEAAQGVIDEGLAVAGRDASFGYWHGRLLRLQATLAASQGRWAEVDALHARSMPLIAAAIGERHVFVEVSTVHRCIAQVSGRLTGEACDALRQRLPALNDVVPLHRFRVHHALGLAADAAGRGAEAREHHLRALAAAQSAGTAHPLWIAHDALAQHLRRSGARALAISFGKTAVEQIEAMRRDFSRTARDSERQFVADKHAVYRRLADWLAEDGRIDEALDVLRLLKTEEFLDFVRRDGAAALAGGPALTPREAGWRAQSPKAGGDGAAAEAARIASWQALLREAADEPPAPARAARAPGRTRPPPGTLAVWLFGSATHLNLVLDSAQRRDVQRLPIDPAALARDIGRLLAQIGRRDDALPLLQSLHAALGAPIVRAAQAARAQRLVLHLDGALRYLPFAALHDGRQYLGERFAIEQRIEPLEAAAAAPGASAPTAPRAAYVRAFGVSRALAGFPALQAVSRELCGIVDGEVTGLDAADGPCERGLLPGVGWLNERFTAERLRAAADSVRTQPAARRELLHLGTHFVLRPGHIGRSWLLTGDAQRLSLDAFAAIDWRGQALITLSACETGLGGAHGADGREVDGLAALLTRRGAGAVIASLWRVEDSSTGALMRALYHGLRADPDPARALQRAQARVRTRTDGTWRHPFYWAGFMLSRPDQHAP
nr:CHAT domain-containing protein [Aquabacterium terrae]